jgi:cell division protein FtsI/penicillin-binding protein 2
MVSNLPKKNSRLLKTIFLLCGGIIIVRLFVLQGLSSGFYRALAESQQTVSEEFVPRRGQIFAQDHNDPTWYPLATNVPTGFVFADPRKIEQPVNLGRALAEVLGFADVHEYDVLVRVQDLVGAGKQSEAEALLATLPLHKDGQVPKLETNSVALLIARLSKKDDPYEPVARDVPEEKLRVLDVIKAPGIQYILQDTRVYPENPRFGGHVLGFLGHDEQNERARGSYGLEGFFNDFLSGSPGSLLALKDAAGKWVSILPKTWTPAVDGGDLYITIDRTLQVTACGMLKDGIARFEADGGALVILQPSTGKVLAMCGAPDFDPAHYGDITDYAAYSNPAIYTAYEPGSIFKPITVAGALETGVITPDSTFVDPGEARIDDRVIHNSGDKIYGAVTMIEALENSINTAMVWAMQKMGREKFRETVLNFGFGQPLGIELNTEVAGDIDALQRPGEIYSATASFGQGITATPLQIAAAYAALANGGMFMQPYIVEKREFSDGTIEETYPKPVRRVVSEETAKKIGAMLVAVVEYGHGKRAQVPGYYIAGKTGTAQIAQNGEYSETAFNGSFAGYGPLSDPVFAMVVKVENPKHGVIYAESTAAPIFGEIADFLLDYYAVAPERETL